MKDTLSLHDALPIYFNNRLREHGLGFEYLLETRKMIKVTNKLLHQEVVRPALYLLHEQDFQGANDEYLTAHQHFREGKFKESMNACLKAFESTMKTICAEQKWDFDGERDSCARLVQHLVDNGLLDKFFEGKINTLKSLLESVATPRNRKSGHGQGPALKEVPPYYAQYMLHLTGSVIVLIVEAHLDLLNTDNLDGD